MFSFLKENKRKELKEIVKMKKLEEIETYKQTTETESLMCDHKHSKY